MALMPLLCKLYSSFADLILISPFNIRHLVLFTLTVNSTFRGLGVVGTMVGRVGPAVVGLPLVVGPAVVGFPLVVGPAVVGFPLVVGFPVVGFALVVGFCVVGFVVGFAFV